MPVQRTGILVILQTAQQESTSMHYITRKELIWPIWDASGSQSVLAAAHTVDAHC